MKFSEPEEPLARRIATEVLQPWINQTGMSARDAVESLALRADKDGFPAERTALCDAIKPRGDDTRNERTALAAARFQLFGCRRDVPIAARPRAMTSPTWRGCCIARTRTWSRATTMR